MIKKEIKDETLLALHKTGHSVRQIEKIVGLSKSAVANRLKHLTPTETTDIFKEYKADILAEKQRQLLMSAENLPPAEQRSIATAFGVYCDKEDKLRGFSPDDRPVININLIRYSEKE